MCVSVYVCVCVCVYVCECVCHSVSSNLQKTYCVHLCKYLCTYRCKNIFQKKLYSKFYISKKFFPASLPHLFPSSSIHTPTHKLTLKGSSVPTAGTCLLLNDTKFSSTLNCYLNLTHILNCTCYKIIGHFCKRAL